jgi:hypothetical protein
LEVTPLPSFIKLNDGWNAEPNSPSPVATVVGLDVNLEFVLNHMKFPAFTEEEKGILRFSDVVKFRIGPTNDEGWYRGQCRYSELAPSWGEFYEILGADPVAEEPLDWKVLDTSQRATRHFLFYFRDNTFEAICAGWTFESAPENALLRL